MAISFSLSAAAAGTPPRCPTCSQLPERPPARSEPIDGQCLPPTRRGLAVSGHWAARQQRRAGAYRELHHRETVKRLRAVSLWKNCFGPRAMDPPPQPKDRFRRNGVDLGTEQRARYLVHTGPCRCLCDRAEDAPIRLYWARITDQFSVVQLLSSQT